MNHITNFYGLSIEDWQRLAHTACYEINQGIKSQGERLFYDITKTPDINIIITLINNGSETLLFVLFSFLNKNPAPFAKNMANLLNIVQSIDSWQFRSFTFVRSNQIPMQKYITRTIMTALGIFLKIGYESQNTSIQLVQFLQQMKTSYFKLYLLKSFVDAVQIIDYQMGYMKYRTMVYNFQDNIIPMICQVLMPYFYNIQEGAQINQLSFLQQHLQVNDLETQTSTSQYQVSITNQQEQQSDYVFMLLQKIVQFNYNITYSEYQTDQPIDTCLITFPDKVALKIINQQFLGALFFIIEKVSEVKTGGKKLEYLQISLGCVAKMMQSRLTYLDLSVRESYVYHALKGLTHLLLKCRQLGNETLLQGIIICNKKLFMNCQLQSLKKTCIKCTQDEGAHLYKTYLKDLTQMIVLVVQNSLVQSQNHLLLQAIELANKIIYSHGYKDQDIIDDEQILFNDFVKAIVHAFISNLAQPTSIFQNNKIISITQNKNLVNQLFQYFKKTGSANYQFLFDCILQKIDSFTSSSNASPVVFANILYFLSQILDHNYLQRNIYLNKANDHEYCALGKIISKMVNLIVQYIPSRTSHFKVQEMFYIDTGVILFIESIVLEFLNGFQFNNHFKIKQKLYFFMTYGQLYNDNFEVEDSKSEETIMTFINILTQFLAHSTYNQQAQIIIQYVLSALQKCIFKIKWHMRREFYLKTQLFKYLLGFFENFFYNRNHIGDVRARISKIVVTLTFDDVLDEYKFRIVKFLNIMKQQPLELLQYDLIGIFEGIQTHSISKYFYNRLKKELDLKQVVASLAQMAKNVHQQKAYKDFCRFIKSMLNNKGFKINNSIITYSLFQQLLPFLTDLLRGINRNNSINMDIWQGSICEIMDIFKTFVSGTYANIFMLQKYTINNNSEVSLIKQFVIQIIKTIILLGNQFQTYPQMQQIMLGIYYELNKQLLDYIFSDNTGRIVDVYMVAHVKLIDTTVNYIKMMMNGNKLVQDKLIKTIDCLRYFFIYFNKKCKIMHQHANISNLKRIYQFSQRHIGNQAVQNKNQHLIDYLISFLMNNKNSFSFFKTVTRLIYELNKTFNPHILNAFGKIQLQGQKLKQIQNMMKMQQKESEQGFIQKIKIWVKQIDLFN